MHESTRFQGHNSRTNDSDNRHLVELITITMYLLHSTLLTVDIKLEHLFCCSYVKKVIKYIYSILIESHDYVQVLRHEEFSEGCEAACNG